MLFGVIIMIKISSVRCAFPEKEEFRIQRRHGHKEYTFLHFHNSVQLLVGDSLITTAPHAVILYAPNTPQYFKSDGPLVHDWFHFSGDMADFLSSDFEVNQVYYPSDHAFITKTVAELETEFFDTRNHRQTLLDLKIRELFLKLERSVGKMQTPLVSSQTEWLFRMLRSEVFASLGEDWSIKNMADRVNLSQSHFYALYKKIFGISPTADLINAKINSAKNMLRFQNSKIEDISISLGYENKTHFIRQFKKAVGLTPSAYRHTHRQ